MKKRGMLLTALSLALPAALILSACSADSPSTEPGDTPSNSTDTLGPKEYADDMQALYDAALENGENTVVVYGAIAGEREKLFDSFTETFPEISVQVEFLTGATLFSRMNQEQASGNYVGDISLTGDDVTVALGDAGHLEAYLPKATAELADEYIGPDGIFAVSTVTPFGVEYNTRDVDEKDVPKSWADLTDPKLQGKMTWVDLTVSGPSAVVAARLIEHDVIDEEWMKSLTTQDVRWVDKASALSGVMATGEAPIVINTPYDYYLNDLATGVPAGFRLFDDNNYVAFNSGALFANAPHPNAAKLLMSWLYSPQAQESMAAIGQYSPMPGAVAPEDMPALEEVKGIPFTPWEDLADIGQVGLEMARGVFN